jgi:hypothetical protein
MTPQDDRYAGRRDRVVVQVFEKWANGATLTEEREADLMLLVTAAADLTYNSRINDLDWEEAALKYLRESNER